MDGSALGGRGPRAEGSRPASAGGQGIGIWILLLIFSLVDFIREVYHTLETTALEVGADWEE